MNSTPAASKTRRIDSRLFATEIVLPSSKFRTVLWPTLAFAASSACEYSISVALRGIARVSFVDSTGDNDFQQGYRIALDVAIITIIVVDNENRY